MNKLCHINIDILQSVHNQGLLIEFDEFMKSFRENKCMQAYGDTLCLCGHRIHDIRYIESIKYNDYIFEVGNCCIKKFRMGNFKTCQFCGVEHKYNNIKKNVDESGDQIYDCIECRNERKHLKMTTTDFQQMKELNNNRDTVLLMWREKQGVTSIKCDVCNYNQIKYKNELYCPLCIEYKESFNIMKEYTFTFGKYYKHYFTQVVDKDFKYILWLYMNTNTLHTILNKHKSTDFSERIVKQTLFYAKRVMDAITI